MMLAMEADIEKLGQQMFWLFLDDLRSLETDGFEIRGHSFRVVIPAIAGDNLGSHWLGGFGTNFSTVQHV